VLSDELAGEAISRFCRVMVPAAISFTSAYICLNERVTKSIYVAKALAGESAI
jgi:hypothetical protein